MLSGVSWCGVVWYGMAWYGMVWYGMVWYGPASVKDAMWYGMVYIYSMPSYILHSTSLDNRGC